jgi:hypothetical protein
LHLQHDREKAAPVLGAAFVVFPVNSKILGSKEGSHVEKTLIKGAVYSFLIATLIGLLLFPDWNETGRSGPYIFSQALSGREYLMRLLRFDALVTLVTLAVLWFKSRIVLTDKQTGVLDFINGVLMAFALGLLVLMVFSYLLTSFR